jgi:hypothetical protein
MKPEPGQVSNADPANTINSRSSRYAAEFETTLAEFIRLIESLTDEQWTLVGRNYPQRLNDEDENRTIGVIAHHVAVSGAGIMKRIQALAEGRPLPPIGSGTQNQALQAISHGNAQHAAEHANVTKEEVLRLLHEQQSQIAAALRAIPDDRLDQSAGTPAGPMSVAQRIERVLIGHVKMHQGSIEAAIS